MNREVLEGERGGVEGGKEEVGGGKEEVGREEGVGSGEEDSEKRRKLN